MITGQILGQFTSITTGLTVTDTSQFLQLVGASNAVKVIEVRVNGAAGSSVLANAIRLVRGTGGAGGTGVLEREWVQGGPSASVAVVEDAPTTEITAVDWEYTMGFNQVSEAVFLSTPAMQLWLRPQDDLGVSIVDTDSLFLDCAVTWQEWAVSPI